MLRVSLSQSSHLVLELNHIVIFLYKKNYHIVDSSTWLFFSFVGKNICAKIIENK